MIRILRAGAAALAAIAVACAGINAQTNAYATLAEARDAGAVARGWVPDGLPGGTHDLREAHVPDTPQRWGIFNFPSEEADALKRLLQAEPVALTGVYAGAPARIEWWPVVLRGRIDGDVLARAGVTAYRAKEGDLVFAVNWNQGRAYYWAIR
jgi:hypothetical protein